MSRLPLFHGHVLVVGLGAVARCTLPLLLDHLRLAPARLTVLDFDAPDEHVRFVRGSGATFVTDRITPASFAATLSAHVGAGDLIIDLAWNIDTATMLQWCRDNGVMYVNASVEVWDPYGGAHDASPADRTLYARHMALREMMARWGSNDGPTAVLDHGANPGLVSHFTKAALEDIAHRWLDDHRQAGRRRDDIGAALAERAHGRLAQHLGVKVIHISERDTQVTGDPKRENEFVNTWSIEGFYEESIAPAELGWGTHERAVPTGAHAHDSGPRNQIFLSTMGCQTWVRSWVPCGEIVGMVIRHGEAFTISEALTVRDAHGAAAYRPTVHYAYCPCDAAIASLHELQMRRYDLQHRQRILGDDILEGRDELGCLLMGHDYTSWWIGSLLDVTEARRLVPHQNATTLQVAASVVAAVRWMIDNPQKGVRVPDELPHDEILTAAKPYLGPFISHPVEWTPTRPCSAAEGNGRARAAGTDAWQFSSFLVAGGHAPGDGRRPSAAEDA